MKLLGALLFLLDRMLIPSQVTPSIVSVAQTVSQYPYHLQLYIQLGEERHCESKVFAQEHNTTTPSLLRSRYLGRHIMLLPNNGCLKPNLIPFLLTASTLTCIRKIATVTVCQKAATSLQFLSFIGSLL